MFIIVSFNPILALKTLACYQFGKEVGDALFKEELIKEMKVKFSGRTKRIRYVFLGNSPYLSIRTSDGFLTLSLRAAKELVKTLENFENLVIVNREALKTMFERKEILAKQIKSVSPNLKANSEVVVIDEDKKFIAVGRAILNGKEMLEIKRGVVIKLRKVGKYV